MEKGGGGKGKGGVEEAMTHTFHKGKLNQAGRD